MKVVITSATENEIDQIKRTVNVISIREKTGIQIHFHICGVGLLSSCFSISKLIFEQKPNLIIQAGIAGTFDNHIGTGNVVAVKDEVLGDVGVEEDGAFKDLFDLNLQSENLFPFTERKLHNRFLGGLNFSKLQEVTAITINEITTRPTRIEALKLKYQPIIESMEGAALHYCGLQTSTPFIQIRAISNYIGERDKSKWKFKDAFNNLAEVVSGYIDQLNNEQITTI
ncbi:futalosine hydrolase [Segetibacter sp.]|jgi:futalosine hydrolase|uniref:futalosine hydrolase n=1 Tax=Segetibacter sp. TaxID=2231182 RepID=UPI00262A38DC|nr:futalosine hydrolase [Segetibacter sp.]MCW3081307.1 mqnB [Segetibacter sp.]